MFGIYLSPKVGNAQTHVPLLSSVTKQCPL